MNNHKAFSKVLRDPESNLLSNGYDIISLGENRVRINDKGYDLTPEIQTAFTDTSYKNNGNDKDDESVTTSTKILENLEYNHAKSSTSKRNK